MQAMVRKKKKRRTYCHSSSGSVLVVVVVGSDNPATVVPAPCFRCTADAGGSSNCRGSFRVAPPGWFIA